MACVSDWGCGNAACGSERLATTASSHIAVTGALVLEVAHTVKSGVWRAVVHAVRPWGVGPCPVACLCVCFCASALFCAGAGAFSVAGFAGSVVHVQCVGLA